MTRSCARPGCSQPAAATLVYDYASRMAWLEQPADEANPMTHDLCTRHADGLSVPLGWELEDRRVVAQLFPDAIAS